MIISESCKAPVWLHFLSAREFNLSGISLFQTAQWNLKPQSNTTGIEMLVVDFWLSSFGLWSLFHTKRPKRAPPTSVRDIRGIWTTGCRNVTDKKADAGSPRKAINAISLLGDLLLITVIFILSKNISKVSLSDERLGWKFVSPYVLVQRSCMCVWPLRSWVTKRRPAQSAWFMSDSADLWSALSLLCGRYRGGTRSLQKQHN